MNDSHPPKQQETPSSAYQLQATTSASPLTASGMAPATSSLCWRRTFEGGSLLQVTDFGSLTNANTGNTIRLCKIRRAATISSSRSTRTAHRRLQALLSRTSGLALSTDPLTHTAFSLSGDMTGLLLTILRMLCDMSILQLAPLLPLFLNRRECLVVVLQYLATVAKPTGASRGI